MWQTIFKPLNVSGCYDELFYYLWLAGVTQVGKHFACNARGCICLPWFCSKMSNSMLNWESVFLTQFCVSVRVFHKAEFIRHLHEQTWALLVLTVLSVMIPNFTYLVWKHMRTFKYLRQHCLITVFLKACFIHEINCPPFLSTVSDGGPIHS